MRSLNIKLILIMALLLLPAVALGYPSNSWKHLESEHFIISYNEKTEDRASTALDIAEEVAAAIGEYFGSDITEERIAIVLNDHYDSSNGSAYRYLPLVNIDSRKTDDFWRGETRWLRQVLSHELSHIYTLRIVQLPVLFSAGLSSYAASGGQKGCAAVNYQHNRLPAWFVEGIAQLGSHQCRADFRDPFREMLLRDAFYHNRLLSLDQMSRFEGTSREYELAYNQGFDLMLYLIDAYPDKPVKPLCVLIRKRGLESAVLRYYGKSVEKLYKEWRASLAERYSNLAESYSKDIESIDGSPMFKEEKKPMTFEVISVDNGKYAITNWRHDYIRFDLMIMSGDRQQVERVITDAGKTLKRDEADNTVWFNREVYNYETGASNYDIYRINDRGRLRRMTKGQRCLAFDVKDNYLMYASYKNGRTYIILRTPDGSLKTLKSFPYDTGIYNISLITTDSAVLSIGTGNRIRAVILKDSSLEMLWEDLDADTLDVICAGSDKLLFVSTILGTPQLYWCDLKKDKNLWYKITDVPGGIRYPSIDGDLNRDGDLNQDGDLNRDSDLNRGLVSCTVYENGQYIIYKLSNPFSKDHPVEISPLLKPAGLLRPERPGLEPAHQGPDKLAGLWQSTDWPGQVAEAKPKKTFANFIVSTPSFHIWFDRYPGSEHLYKNSDMLTVGSSFVVQNAPNNFGVGINFDLNYPMDNKTVSSLYPSFGIWANMDLGQMRLLQEFALSNHIIEYEEKHISEKLEEFDSETSLSYQLLKDDYVSVSYGSKSISSKLYGNSEYQRDLGTLYRGNAYSLDWKHISDRSKFDPGRLGGPCFAVKAGVDYIKNSYPGYDADSVIYDSEDSTVSKIRFGAMKRSLLFNSKLSLKFSVDGFSYNGNIRSGKISRFMYEYIGREDMFSGYSNDRRAVRVVRGYGEMRFNPFISVLNGTSWYERMNLGLKFEIGSAECFDNFLPSEFLTSIEGALRYFLYLWPNNVSSAYLKCAMPLQELPQIGNSPSCRIYFGLSIN